MYVTGVAVNTAEDAAAASLVLDITGTVHVLSTLETISLAVLLKADLLTSCVANTMSVSGMYVPNVGELSSMLRDELAMYERVRCRRVGRC